MAKIFEIMEENKEKNMQNKVIIVKIVIFYCNKPKK